MKLHQTPPARSATRPAIAVEPLEIRQLLAADIGIFYDVNGDGKFDSADSFDFNGNGTIEDNEKNGRIDQSNDGETIDLGTTTQGASFSSHLFRIRNEGDQVLNVVSILETFGVNFYTVLGSNGQPLYPGGVLQQKVLGAGANLDVKFGVNTAIKGELIDTVSISSTDFDESTRTLSLHAQVISTTPSATTNWGLLSSDKSDTFLLTGRNVSNDNGNALINISDQLIKFELGGTTSSVELSLSGLFRSDSDVKYGRPQAILVRDSNGDGKMSIAEREAALATLTATPPNSTKTNTLNLPAGKYLIYLTAISGQVGAGQGTGGQMKLDATVGLKINPVATPRIEVRGKDVIINNGDTTPSTTDGTSFGSLVEGSAPTLTFVLKNTGGSALTVTGQRPTVSGDFIVTEALNSSIVAGGSDSFTVQLINTAPGAKTGSITIQTNAGNFTFKIGGTLTSVTPPGSFVVRNGSKLTVSGTPGNDVITINSSFNNLVITRNGVASQPFSITQITGIVVNCGDGNDSVTSTTALRINMTLNGQNGKDRLRAAKGKDQLFGGAGDDVLDGAGSADVLDGGTGSDYAYYGTRGTSLTITLDNLANDGEVNEKDLITSTVENVQGGKSNDRITGDGKRNILVGGAGNDVLNGLDGNDRLDAGGGKNTLNGGGGNDVLLAVNNQQDVVDGGDGDDDGTVDPIDLITNVES
jgi:Ca2+-binding RTX toxin-like protein